MSRGLGQLTGRVVVSDGAWGTQLQGLGLPPGACPEEWNRSNPDAVQAVAAGYVEAGSEVILTNTFRANRVALAETPLADSASELAEAGAAISRRAAGEDVRVFASMGPTGKILMMGDVSAEQVYAAFAEQAAAVARGGADAIVCETFAALDEAALAVRAIIETTDLPVVLSMTFDSGPDRTATMMGVTPADLAASAEQLGAAAVGANCGAGPEHYVKVAALLRQATALPIWIKPNAGLPVLEGGKTVFPMGPDAFAAYVPALIDAGATFLGGCCGTTPEHIRAVRKAVG
ncbi:MAG TPA: homocysteine S-methyltransferase family protein [Phycisphaerae bacterium]|nr:homocysteine S-methyltransferase family protein [Phycisphaerae bacterium]